MFNFLFAIDDIIDAISFGKKAHDEKKQNRKWRLIGAGLLLLFGIAGLIFTFFDWFLGVS